MLTLNQKIRKWSRAVNRNKTFTPIEMEEMEDHLLVEIKQMVEFDHLSEEVAFQQATKSLGEQGILDEEYGKVRWSAFFKVKLWAYLQTFVILGLVLFLVVPYIHFPVNNNNGFVVGQEIGEIGRWAYDASKNSPDSYVTHQNEVWFYNQEQKNIYSYQYSPKDFVTINLFLTNSYFTPPSSSYSSASFDIDSKKDFYFLDKYDISIDIYRNAKKIRDINLPEKLNYGRFETIKVIQSKLIVGFTESEKLKTEKGWEERDISSSLLIHDLKTDVSKWETLNLKNVILSMDRSEDQLAILYVTGEIEIYAIQQQKLTLIDTVNIINFPSFLSKHLAKSKDSIQAKIEKYKNSLLSVFKPNRDKAFKLGSWDDFNQQFEKPKASFFNNVMTKIKQWKIIKKFSKPSPLIASRFYPIGYDNNKNPINGEVPWKEFPDQVWWGRTGFLMPDAKLAKDPNNPIINIPATNENKFCTTPLFWTIIYQSDEGNFLKRMAWYVIYDDAGQLWFDPDGHFNDPRYNARADLNDPNYIPGSNSLNPQTQIDNLPRNNTQGPYILDDKNNVITFNNVPNKDNSIVFEPKPTDTIDHTFSNCHISLLFSKKNHQLVLVENNNRFSYLVPNGKELQILPLTDKDIAGVMKVNFIDPERLVVIKKDSTNPSADRLNLYLFKD